MPKKYILLTIVIFFIPSLKYVYSFSTYCLEYRITYPIEVTSRIGFPIDNVTKSITIPMYNNEPFEIKNDEFRFCIFVTPVILNDCCKLKCSITLYKDKNTDIQRTFNKKVALCVNGDWKLITDLQLEVLYEARLEAKMKCYSYPYSYAVTKNEVIYWYDDPNVIIVPSSRTKLVNNEVTILQIVPFLCSPKLPIRYKVFGLLKKFNYFRKEDIVIACVIQNNNVQSYFCNGMLFNTLKDLNNKVMSYNHDYTLVYLGNNIKGDKIDEWLDNISRKIIRWDR